MSYSRKLSINSDLVTSETYTTEEGYRVNTNVPIARTGIITYKAFEFGIVGIEASKDFPVLRQADSFNVDILKQLSNLPLTNSHPESALNSQNISDELIGTLGDKLYMQDGDLIAEKVVIYDSKSIQEITSGEKQEVSIGFDAEYEYAPGELDGQKYDYIEKITRVNHLALVKRGKAGPRYRLNEMVQPITTTTTEKEDFIMSKMVVNEDQEVDKDKEKEKVEADNAEVDATPEKKVAAENGDVLSEIKDMLTSMMSAIEALSTSASTPDDSAMVENEEETEEDKKDEEKEKEEKTNVKNSASLKNAFDSSKSSLHLNLKNQSPVGGKSYEFTPRKLSAQDMYNSLANN